MTIYELLSLVYRATHQTAYTLKQQTRIFRITESDVINDNTTTYKEIADDKNGQLMLDFS